MRYLFLLTIILCGVWGHALHAQEDLSDDSWTEDEYTEAPLSAEPWRKQLDQLTARLSLTPEQIPAAEQLFAAYYTDLSDNPPATPELKRARKRAFRARFVKLLTPEQQATLRSSRGAGSAKPGNQKKRHWLDAIIDDVATPLLEKRKKNRRKGG